MWTVQEAAAKEEQWQKRADQREHERRVRESRKHRQQAQVKSLQTSQSCLPIAVSAPPPPLPPPPSPPASPPPSSPPPLPPQVSSYVDSFMAGTVEQYRKSSAVVLVDAIMLMQCLHSVKGLANRHRSDHTRAGFLVISIARICQITFDCMACMDNGNSFYT